MPMSSLEVSDLQWRKARGSANNGACLEAAPVAGTVLIRDSKDRNGIVIQFSGTSWRMFVQAAKGGRYDLERL
jgi:Domain of unknown function (DUF397)